MSGGGIGVGKVIFSFCVWRSVFGFEWCGGRQGSGWIFVYCVGVVCVWDLGKW